MRPFAGLAFAATIAVGVLCPPGAGAQAFPSKPLRLVVPYATGGVGYGIVGNTSPEQMASMIQDEIKRCAQAPRRIRELLILRGAQVSGTRYEWVHHLPMARAAGVSQEQIDALDDRWEESGMFDGVEKAVLRLADEVTRGPGASADCIAGLRQQGLSDAEVTELTLTASFYVCVSRFLQSMDVPLEEDAHG